MQRRVKITSGAAQERSLTLTHTLANTQTHSCVKRAITRRLSS